jgi:hypothetical protein
MTHQGITNTILNNLINNQPVSAGILSSFARGEYFEYPKMLYDLVLITSLRESRDIRSKVDILINEN